MTKRRDTHETAEPTSEEYDAFEKLARKLVKVPKADLDKARADDKSVADLAAKRQR